MLTAANLEAIRHTKAIHKYKRLVLLTTLFAVPTFIIFMVLGSIESLKDSFINKELREGSRLRWGGLLGLLLATPVQFWLGKDFYVNSWKALRHKSATMDVLIALGTSVAYLYSLFSTLYGLFVTDYTPKYFFEVSVLLIFFILLGKLLENLAKRKTSDAIGALLQLQVPECTLLLPDPENTELLVEQIINIGLVQRGDLIKVYPGATIPVDGSVASGATHIDESMITGESLPVAKLESDLVLAGTTNQEGMIHVRATKTSSETMLSQIVKLVANAQSSKAPIQAVADKISRYFVPIVLVIALLTFIVWISLSTQGLIDDSWIEGKTLLTRKTTTRTDPLYFPWFLQSLCW